MVGLFKGLGRGLEDIIFPDVCLSCGSGLNEENRYICSFCLQERFQDPNPQRGRTCSGSILPDDILFQDALWQFDKGGRVQNILHAIKYQGLANLGSELGRNLGIRLLDHPIFKEFTDKENFLLVPVPLHSKKLRKRGYNQARYIAKGVSEVCNIPMIEEGGIQRIRFTQTQTGFSIRERLKNVKKAFKVIDKHSIYGKKLIIVDDVFTTGATSFELASACKLANAQKAIILTIAQA